MVGLEELAALDLQIWLRTGPQAARALGCNQSTISRRVERTLGVFRLKLHRRGGEWHLRGHLQLLRMQRELHQCARFLGQEPLRLEISPLMVPLLAQPPLPGWRLGRGDMLGLLRPLQLLRERILDAWLIDNSVDLPAPEDPEFVRFDLARYPLWLAAVDGLGLSGVTLRSRHYDPADWEGRTADGVSLTYATPFNLANHLELRPLDSEPLLSNGVSLVVRRDQPDQPAIQSLRAEVLRRFQLLQPRLPTLQRLA